MSVKATAKPIDNTPGAGYKLSAQRAVADKERPKGIRIRPNLFVPVGPSRPHTPRYSSALTGKASLRVRCIPLSITLAKAQKPPKDDSVDFKEQGPADIAAFMRKVDEAIAATKETNTFLIAVAAAKAIVESETLKESNPLFNWYTAKTRAVIPADKREAGEKGHPVAEFQKLLGRAFNKCKTFPNKA